MKTKKIVALVLSMAMVLGVVAACNKTTESTGAATDASAATSASTEASSDASADTSASETESQAPAGKYKQLDVVDGSTLTDSGDLLVWSWNEEIGGLIKNYYSGSNFDMSKSENYNTVKNDGGAYKTALTQVLASGDNAPDLYGVEVDYIKSFMDADKALALSELGIANSELEAAQYDYTLALATDDSNVIRGISWQCCPAAVFYNRMLADKYLGVSDPDGVGQWFSSWDKFIETAKKVDADSNHTVKAVASISDVERPYLNTRTQGWVVDGKLTFDPQVEAYLDFGKQLYSEGLTFNAAQWSDTAWTDGVANSTVLSYFGPMWLGHFSLAMWDDANGNKATKDEWGLCAAPTPYYWGGSWLVASKYCDAKASSAQVMRDVCLNEANLTQIAKNGDFANNKVVMKNAATDDSFCIVGLGNQNPYSILTPVADDISADIVTPYDQDVQLQLDNFAPGYFDGTTATKAEVLSAIEAACKDVI